MNDKTPSNSVDKALFLEAIGDVKRLKLRQKEPDKVKLQPRPRQLEADEQLVLEELLCDPSEDDLVEAEEHLSWARAGVQNSVLRRLRNGKYSIQAELDLHGYTQEQARSEIVLFIAAAKNTHRFCVRIIHGKGRKTANRSPILKTSVNHWLRQHQHVLAFCSSQINDGGAGAVTVLLRKK
jgi:DNA-nicking Smr family endonuclease